MQEKLALGLLGSRCCRRGRRCRSGSMLGLVFLLLVLSLVFSFLFYLGRLDGRWGSSRCGLGLRGVGCISRSGENAGGNNGDQLVHGMSFW